MGLRVLELALTIPLAIRAMAIAGTAADVSVGSRHRRRPRLRELPQDLHDELALGGLNPCGQRVTRVAS